MAEAAFAKVNTETGLDYWLPWDPNQELQQERDGGPMAAQDLQELQHVRAERHGAVRASLVNMMPLSFPTVSQYTENIVCLFLTGR